MPENPTVSVADGEILTVSADAGSYGTVFGDGNAQWTVGAKSPLHLGPGRYRIETVTGTVRHELNSRAVAALQATLPRATDMIQSAVVIAKAINKGTDAMLKDKFARIADRAKTVPAAFSDRADKVLSRFDAVETRGGVALDKIEQGVIEAEQGVIAIEDAVNQLTNGAQ